MPGKKEAFGNTRKIIVIVNQYITSQKTKPGTKSRTSCIGSCRVIDPVMFHEYPQERKCNVASSLPSRNHDYSGPCIEFISNT